MLVAVNLATALGAMLGLSWSHNQHDTSLGRFGSAAALVLLLGSGAWSAIQPGAAGHRRVAAALLALGGAGVIFGGSGYDTGRPFAAGLSCAAIVLAAAVIPAFLTAQHLSGFAYSTSRALVGAASAGVGGVLALHFHCPIGAAPHLAAFHALPWALVIVLTTQARRRLPSRSFAP